MVSTVFCTARIPVTSLCALRSYRGIDHAFDRVRSLQELRTLRETREGLDDQIDRLEWAINHGTQDSLSVLTTSSASEEDDAADEELLEVRLAEAKQLKTAVGSAP